MCLLQIVNAAVQATSERYSVTSDVVSIGITLFFLFYHRWFDRLSRMNYSISVQTVDVLAGIAGGL